MTNRFAPFPFVHDTVIVVLSILENTIALVWVVGSAEIPVPEAATSIVVAPLLTFEIFPLIAPVPVGVHLTYIVVLETDPPICDKTKGLAFAASNPAPVPVETSIPVGGVIEMSADKFTPAIE